MIIGYNLIRDFVFCNLVIIEANGTLLIYCSITICLDFYQEIISKPVTSDEININMEITSQW